MPQHLKTIKKKNMGIENDLRQGARIPLAVSETEGSVLGTSDRQKEVVFYGKMSSLYLVHPLVRLIYVKVVGS
jgi:hypothetical protein